MHNVRDRADTALEHMAIGWRSRWRRLRDEPERVDEPEDEAEEGGSNAALFFWGMLTALTLWWLYLRPGPTERRLSHLRAGPRAAGPEPRAASATGVTQAAPPQVTITPPADASEGAESDDLTLIYGIGPARATRLVEAGIGTFAALAVADAEQLRDILTGVGVSVGNADVASWPEQASLAARGDWEGLEAYKEQLRADRG